MMAFSEIAIGQSHLDEREITLNGQSMTVIDRTTAFDIAGPNIAFLSATRSILDLIVGMNETHRADSDAAPHEKTRR